MHHMVLYPSVWNQRGPNSLFERTMTPDASIVLLGSSLVKGRLTFRLMAQEDIEEET